MFTDDNQNNLLLTMIISIVSVFFIYQYRYRLMNRILGTQWIRRLAVTGVMQIPYLRERIFTRFMPF